MTDKEELFLFGYACRLFRDDEKALHIDQGKHLIPWMGDDKLKIDRYDYSTARLGRLPAQGYITSNLGTGRHVNLIL